MISFCGLCLRSFGWFLGVAYFGGLFPCSFILVVLCSVSLGAYCVHVFPWFPLWPLVVVSFRVPLFGCFSDLLYALLLVVMCVMVSFCGCFLCYFTLVVSFLWMDWCFLFVSLPFGVYYCGFILNNISYGCF